ncbi:MAG: hypothetical protein IRY83_17710 [Chloroflexi bacterium]|nr:hypothetical protein [Chloroflexota bacterium]
MGASLVLLVALAGNGALSAAGALLRERRRRLLLDRLVGRELRVVRIVKTWSYVGGGEGEELVGREEFDARLEAVTWGEGPGELRLEFASDEMDRAISLESAEVGRLGDVVTIWAGEVQLWIKALAAGRAEVRAEHVV